MLAARPQPRFFRQIEFDFFIRGSGGIVTTLGRPASENRKDALRMGREGILSACWRCSFDTLGLDRI
jgi:hypothetical protein